MTHARFALPYLIAATFAFAGCAPVPSGHPAAAKPTLLPAPAKLPASQVSTLTFYRPGEGDVEDRHPTIALNGSDLVTLYRHRVFTARVLPGEYRITLDDDKAGTLRTKPGEHYYFYLAIVPGGFGGHGRLGLVSPQQGGEQSASLEPPDRDDIENPAFR